MIESKYLRTYVGLAMLAAVGFQPQAQQARRDDGHVIRPTEKITVDAVTLDWSEMVHMQASVPQMATLLASESSLTLEAPPIEIPMVKNGKTLAPATAGGVESLGFGPCTGFGSEPPVGAAFDSQLDVPDGMGFSFIPPDVAGAVGPAHLMTMLNNQVLITDRLGGSPVVVDTSTFWSALGTTPASPTHTFPRVYFDDLSGRWLASIRNGVGSLGTTTLFFAISQTDDPTGTWDFYSFPGDPLAASQADWVQLGYNATWIVLSADMLNLAGTAFAGGPKLWAIDKATALVPGGPITVNIFPAGFMTTIHGSGGTRVMPARVLDSDPNMWFVNTAFTSTDNFLAQLTRMTGTGPAPVVAGLPGSPFGGTTSFCVLSTNFSGTQRNIAQIGEARFISPFSNRVASVAVRNGKIWMAQSAGLPGPASNPTVTSNGVIWHQIDPTLPFPGTIPPLPGTMPVQSGAITNGINTMSAFPSIAVNCADDVLIGFANGDATRSPRACYTFRLGTDAPSFMGPIQELKAGESTYWKNFGVGTTAQYGRYTSTCVDPNDDKTLWTLQEYADTRVGGADNDSRWGTHWGRLGDCEELPVITDDPDSVVSCVGDPVSFTVVATSASAISYQWRKNGIDIPGETSSTLSIAATVAGDAGSYDCVVCSCGQATSASATLGFAGAVITTQPVSQVVAIGGSASFFVAATGSGTLSYQWLKNGNPILLETSDTLSFASVIASDYASYACVVTDDCGPVTSDSAQLQSPVVNHLGQATFDLHIFKGPSDTQGCVGDSASFSVVAFPSNATYVWRKDGTPLVPAQTGATLTLSPLSASDAGSYDVVVSLGSRSRTSSAAVLTVNDAPLITVHPSPAVRTVNAGIDVTYSVTATGFGNLTYQWRKRPFVPFAPFVDLPGETSPTLFLENITGADAGAYRCVVTNECGSVVSDQARLRIL